MIAGRKRGLHFFFFETGVKGSTISVADSEQVHHIAAVLRLKPGDKVTVADNRGNIFTCRIEAINKKVVLLEVLTQEFAAIEIPRLTVACALPKQSKMDDIIDRLTQAGAAEIIPMTTERVVARLDEDAPERAKARLERWRKIARNAAEQSQRACIPEIPGILSFELVLEAAKNSELKLIATLEGDRRPLREVLKGVKPESLLLLIGPEGDFSPEEVKKALKAGCRAVSLGKNVLRVETAAIIAAGFIRFTYEAD